MHSQRLGVSAIHRLGVRPARPDGPCLASVGMHPIQRFLGQAPAVPEAVGRRLDRVAAQWLPASMTRTAHGSPIASPIATPMPTTTTLPTKAPHATAVDPAIDPVVDVDEGSERDDGMASSIGLLRPSASRRLRLPDRSALRAVVVIALAGALIAGWMWWQGRPRPVVVAPSALAQGVPLRSDGAGDGAVPVAGEVVVHVTGAVRHPGLVRLPAGARVNDAILAVGGARSEKALASVNLARILVDGEQIVVGAPVSGAVGGSSGGSAAGGIDLNRASASDLESLPGVGPVLAQRIVDWRTANGPFRSVDELGEVSGIGDAVLAQIRASARV